MRAGVCGAFELGIEYGYRRWKLGVRHMVVAYYEIDAAFGCIAYFVDGLYSAVENYYELYAAFGHIVYAFAGYAVAFLVAGGDIVFELGVKILQIAVHKGHGRGAVHIVVAIYEDFFFRAHRTVQPLDGFVHIRH
ncbi:hypothetical protein IMSAGC008_02229 [Muribaculaceae bacterium]|nr:hypothetical protein IMSAGC008_02229 [Muribaculaceae bacterium]